MAVLDTTALLDLMRKPSSPEHGRIAAHIARLVRAGEGLATTRVNVAELWVGVERSVRREEERVRVERTLTGLTVLELDEAAAARFGAVKAHLQRAGRVTGDFDMLIAAIALASGERVVTRNPRHFIDVPGLTVDAY